MEHDKTAEWVDSRMAALTDTNWNPDAARVWSRLQKLKTQSPRVLWGAVFATAAICLAMLAIPSSRALAQRIWESVFLKRVHVVQVNLDNMKSLTAEFVRKPGTPTLVPDRSEAARLAGFTPSLPTTLSGSPRLSVAGPMHARLTLRRSAIQRDLGLAGAADVTVPEQWEGTVLTATIHPVVIAEYTEVMLAQSSHISLIVPQGVSMESLGEIAFRMLGSDASQAKVLARKFADNPSWFLGIAQEDNARLEQVSLAGGPAMLIEDFDDRGRPERTALVWSSPDRVYALSGRMTRELAVATANSIR